VSVSPQRDWLTADFDFDLPAQFIAQMPAEPRDAARLLHVGTALTDCHIRDLPEILRVGDVLVMNDTKVIPARLYGRRGTVEIEILLHRRRDKDWLAFARPGKRLHVGDTIEIAPDFSASVRAKQDSGEIVLRFSADDEKLSALLEQYGEAPLPPYIKRDKGGLPQDRERYQTIYAAHAGAVAAPTAGLHFTPNLLARLAEKKIECATLTLHVGAGTFLPVKAERVRDHVMHAEWGEIRAGTAAYLNKARAEGRRLVAVGTTSLRLLESACSARDQIAPFAGETDIFITPGYRFQAVDAVLTNFHLPKSTLFMLVAAFAGLERMRGAYEHAKAAGYRFYSYGDATLLERGSGS
jgi:S-adenosylmethionine:tRNA ribosyltransferase-isomerase